jgi:tRNA(Arg) A34 adenosine deaminase TadA
MANSDDLNRRNFLATTTTVAAAAAGAIAESAQAQEHAPAPQPPVVDPHAPLANYWQKQVFELAHVDLAAAAPELARDDIKERHRIFSLLLMKLIRRFWNGNKSGPLGTYPRRAQQRDASADRYRGDMLASPDSFRVNWDRYLGHNIACLAVDGNGEIIDFDFNHNNVFRSTVEHAESRLIRRLFSLTNISDSWNTGDRLPGKSRGFSLNSVTLYTSLESCAQCSGIMSLGQVKEVIYLQRDPTTYVVGNFMFNLAGKDSQNRPLSPIPVPASAIDLPVFDELNTAYKAFFEDITDAKKANDKSRAFYISPDETIVDYDPSITSFLCSDRALDIFSDGAQQFDALTLKFPRASEQAQPAKWTNQKCLQEAKRFYDYADIEGYRGSPHKL